MRRRAPRRLALALEGFTATLAPPTVLARVQGLWTDVVGETLAEECRPVSERDGAVTVACRSSVWAQELAMMETDLVERLNAALGGAGVAELRFRVGKQL